jgi:hypothetical protein
MPLAKLKPACCDRDARRRREIETPHLQTSRPGSCASCRSPSSSRREVRAPSSPAHRPTGPPILLVAGDVDGA